MSHSALAAGVRHLRSVIAAQHHRDESDEQLLHAFADDRDDSAFAALVHRHGPMVMAVCRRVLGHQQDAEDAFQATFLMLARNAAALRKKTALASFLHGTAYRTALAAKRAAARRRKHERQAPARHVDGPSAELLWREVRTLLDEEIARLPEIYRSVLVLCCLENLSQAEAARRLGLKDNTVTSRLAGARKRLQRRLTRRGVELTAMALTTETASALPAMLLTKTIGGTVSPTAAALADSIATILSLGKIKLAAAIVLAASVLTGAGLWAYQNSASPSALPAEPPAAKASDKPKTAPPKREAAKTVEIQGRVLGPDGKPKAGAKLLLLGTEDAKITMLGVSVADGRFTITIPKEPKYRRLFRHLVAQADGLGIDFIGLGPEMPAKPVEFRLVKDNIVRGRIVNTEGKPIAGVRVTAQRINVHVNNSVDTFLAAYLKILTGGKGHAELKSICPTAGALIAATTDAGGHFTLHGIGAERTATLLLSGGGIADTVVRVVNRAGFDPKPYNQAFREHFILANGRIDQRWMLSHLLSSPDLAVVAESEKVIRGVAKDAETGKGVAGLEIRLFRYPDEVIQLFNPKAKTDAEGRYEIHGGRKAKRYLVQFRDDAAMGYTHSQVWADDTPGYQPVRADLKVKKGVIVTGKVVDRATGATIPGWAGAAVLSGNPFVKDYSKFDTPSPAPFVVHSENMDDNGVYRLVTVPGPVLLMGGPNHQKLAPLEALKYKQAVADPEYPNYFQMGPGATDEMRLTYSALQGFRRSVDGNFCKVLNVKPGIALVKQDIVLECANALTVKIQDAEDRPLAGVWVTGISPRTRYRAFRLEKDSCPVYNLEVGKPRFMVFCEPSRKLAAARTLQGDEKAPVVVKLGPMGAIKGRLLDANGKPLSGVIVDLHYRENQAEEIHDHIHEGKQIITDANGAFTFDELLPEAKFELSFRRDKQKFEPIMKPADPAVQVKPGECRDVGVIKLKPAVEKTGE